MDLKEDGNRKSHGISRKTFLGSSAALVGGALLHSLPVEASAYVSGGEPLKLALIGCGSRGTGAAVQALRSVRPVELVAMADIFRDMLDRSYDNLTGIEDVQPFVQVPEEHKFVGLDAYKEAIDLADVVILATPPAFRPLHFEAAVQADKHVFLEKALATDGPGVRTILSAGKLAKEKNLSVVVGLQYRYSLEYIELVNRIKEGGIGDIVSANTQRFGGHITLIRREPEQTELEFQLRNWRYFNWQWGGSPVGLNIHHTDIVNWVKEAYPVQAHGVGGRAALNDPDHGDIFDHYSIEYQYEDGTKMHSPIRTIDGCHTNAAFYLQGTDGTADLRGGIQNRKGETVWRYRDIDDPSPYQREIDILFQSILDGKGVNDTEWGAHSTLTAIMGRMAAHSGQIIRREDALNSDLRLVPELHSFEDEAPVLPNEDGTYNVPVPGKTAVL
ncbi:MAG: Gfo/Idh/MocA family oxidoreductase [Balneolaceae bacterium]